MSYISSTLDERIQQMLLSGAVGFMPSDTIYGLSCQALNKEAVEKLHKIKERQENKPFVVLISDIKMLNKLSIAINSVDSIKKYWPGPLTFVAPASNAPSWLTLGLNSLAIRIPSDVKLVKLLERTGPLISTSANISGQPPIETATEAISVFGEELDFYVDGGLIHSLPSTIVQSKNGKLNVLREGAVKIDEKELADDI